MFGAKAVGSEPRSAREFSGPRWVDLLHIHSQFVESFTSAIHIELTITRDAFIVIA